MQLRLRPRAWFNRTRAISGPVLLCVVLAGAVAGCGGGDRAAIADPASPPGAQAIGGTVSGLTGTGLVLQNNAGDDLAVASDGSFRFATPVASGAAYAVTVKTQPSVPRQTCMVSGGSGTVAAAAVTNVTVNCATVRSQFVYATADTGPNQLYAFTVDPDTGTLTSVGTAPTGSYSYSVAVTRDGRFAYSSDHATGAIRGFSVDETTGALMALAGSPFANVVGRTRGLAVVPGDRFLIAVKQSVDRLAVHRIDAATGQLEYLGIAATGSQPTHLAVTPNGKFVYVSNFSSQSISGYAFDAATGTLTPVPGSPFTGVTGNLMVEIEPRGKFLYAPSYIGNAVAGFAIDQATGALSPVPGSPFAGGADSYWAAADPTGKYLYAAARGADQIDAYKIDASTGSLTPLAGSPFSTATKPSAVAVDPGGKFVLTVHELAGPIQAHTIDPATGALTTGSSMSLGEQPRGIAFVAR